MIFTVLSAIILITRGVHCLHMTEYEAPEVTELGPVETVTEGRHFSRVDGNSGTTGNNGNGGGGLEIN